MAWALLAKTLPPRLAHLLGAHLVEQTTEMCDILQETLQKTIRQCVGVTQATADQLEVAKPLAQAGDYICHISQVQLSLL